MTGLFSLIMVLLVAFALVFVGYYAWRLVQLRRASDDSSRRMSAMMLDVRSDLLEQGQQAGVPSVMRAGTMSGAPRGGESPAGSTVPSAGLSSRTFERTVALRALSPNPVYLRRDRAGEITIQIDDRAPMPLKYVLDARARQTLQEVSMVAGVEYGDRWSVLAAEDDRGRLVLTRLA